MQFALTYSVARATLSYCVFIKKRASVTPCDAELERVMGIEPTSKAWEAFVLPLNYTRKKKRSNAARSRPLNVKAMLLIGRGLYD